MSESIRISVVVPVHNGAQHLEELCLRIFKSLPQIHELILVDDGSKDASWKKIEFTKKSHGDSVTGIRLSKNYGQHNATMCGIGYATGDVVITMDDDFRHSPEQLPELIAVWKESDAELVYGVNKKYAGTASRAAASNLIKRSTRLFSEHKFGEGSSFRLMTRGLVDRLKENRGHTVFIDEVVHWYTNRIEVAAITDESAQANRSRYSAFRLFKLYTEVMHNYAVWPLRIMIFIGALASSVSFILGVFFIIKKLMFNVAVPGFTATIVTILFSASLILLSLGIIGLYIFKLYQIQSGKPSFTISKIV